MAKFLPPFLLRKRYFDEIEYEIDRIYRELLYDPLQDIVENEITNSLGHLVDAVKRGTVWYADGYFYGRFNASISKGLKQIGATYQQKSKRWRFEGQLPPEISMANAAAARKYGVMKEDILRRLGQVDLSRIDQISNIPDQYIKTIRMMEGDFKRTIRSIGIAPELTTSQRNTIAADWSYNLDLYIKKWAAKDIIDLRQKIQEPILSGGRSRNLEKMIADNYKVSKNKARFLARQETSLLVSKFRETRYLDLGLTEYKWKGAMDQRERPDHKALQNRIFRWDEPPVTDQRTGARNNPGEDYNCRCVAIPVVR